MQANFNPEEDADEIRKALTKPKDMNILIKIIAHRSNNQRQEILKEYFRKYQRLLINDIKSELSGNFKEAVIALFSLPVDFDCDQLNKAMKKLGTNEDTLIEILASRSNERINQIKEKYKEVYVKDLVKDVESDTSGSFKKLLVKLLKTSRPNNSNPDKLECEDCAKRLFNAVKNKKESFHDTFIYIFTEKSREEIALIGKIYYEMYSVTLIELVDTVFKGDFRKTLKYIIYSLLNPSEFFAYRINKALKGLGTKDAMLIRILVSRDEIDMYRIKRYYKQLYQKSLYDAIKDDTSGDYRTLLLELIGN